MQDDQQQENPTIKHCSFCLKSRDQVTWLTAGPGGLFICNECAEYCRGSLEKGQLFPRWRDGKPVQRIEQ